MYPILCFAPSICYSSNANYQVGKRWALYVCKPFDGKKHIYFVYILHVLP